MNSATVLVLASGRGTRFTASGGLGNKLQARLGNRTVLQHTLDVVRASGLAWYLEDSGQPGHPVGFAPECCAALRALQGAAGAASVLAAYGAVELPVDDIGCVTDIDTVAELQAAARLMPTKA